jgi:hypothetical protein
MVEAIKGELTERLSSILNKTKNRNKTPVPHK